MSAKTLLLLVTTAILLTLIQGEPLWNDLKITVGARYDHCDDEKCSGVDTHGNENDHLLQRLPRTKNDLSSEWKVLHHGDCEHEGTFNGQQWIRSHDLSYALLFDIQGTIAGIQFLIPLKEAIDMRQMEHYQYKKQPQIQQMVIESTDYLYTTVYFIEPCLICKEGRPENKLLSEGTFNGLYLQNGTTPDKFIRLPLNRIQATKDGYAENSCHDGMGWHSYYDVDSWEADNCRSYSPLFLMFNNAGSINALGFIFTGKGTAPSVERPNGDFAAFLTANVNGTVGPKCVRNVGNNYGLSGIHVFFNDRPNDFKCDLPYQPPSYFSASYLHYLEDKFRAWYHRPSCISNNNRS